MIRITRKVFTDLTIWMIGLGLLVGFLFPFFYYVIGIPSQHVLTPWFFTASMVSGYIVGSANLILARMVVGRRLRTLADSMHQVEGYLKEISQVGDIRKKLPEFCTLEIDSEDEIGESAQAFNSLTQSLVYSLRTESAVREFVELITSQIGLNDLTEKALQRLIQYTAACAGAILVEMDGTLQVTSSYGIRSPDKIAESDHVRRALQTEEIQRLELPQDTLVENILTDFIPREIIVAPILYEKELLGVIILASDSGFTNEDIGRMTLFLKGLALAIRNSIDHENLQRLAALDPLSGIYNRRFGLSRLHEEFSRAVRMSSPMAVLMCDIDHFKKINDTFGHLIGDRVISHFVKAARSNIREGDIAVRYGGDEFLLILPAASIEDAHQIGERVRRSVKETVLYDGDREIKVTISMGIAVYPGDEIKDETDLVNKADNRLYEAKGVGRDRVVAG